MSDSTLKQPGCARFVFISRISPKKNLPFAIRLLGTVSGKATLDIYGPKEDQRHWKTCQKEIDALPPHVSVNYCGAIASAEVPGTFAKYEFFLFPTFGENFGYVIYEALSVGIPVLLSDEVTPWEDLQKRMAGFLPPLNDLNAWKRALQFCVDCDLETYRVLAGNAYRYARDVPSIEETKKAHREMFHRAIRMI
jgi:glycosyltransferase involved in cell wall biosynthesis